MIRAVIWIVILSVILLQWQTFVQRNDDRALYEIARERCQALGEGWVTIGNDGTCARGSMRLSK